MRPEYRARERGVLRDLPRLPPQDPGVLAIVGLHDPRQPQQPVLPGADAVGQVKTWAVAAQAPGRDGVGGAGVPVERLGRRRIEHVGGREPRGLVEEPTGQALPPGELHVVTPGRSGEDRQSPSPRVSQDGEQPVGVVDTDAGGRGAQGVRAVADVQHLGEGGGQPGCSGPHAAVAGSSRSGGLDVEPQPRSVPLPPGHRDGQLRDPAAWLPDPSPHLVGAVP